ncbi:hypothetical protein [uncultured Tyzzerella sp.]|uniref:hypothetical protein n=1 Tax=uncultured Tyzzerella sp. TaxID=2321398 RepID=UPI002943315E|nr:hypothetical protein [uncultured Tyzzerella sp.]
MKQKIIMILAIFLFLALFIMTIFNSPRRNINVSTNGGNRNIVTFGKNSGGNKNINSNIKNKNKGKKIDIIKSQNGDNGNVEGEGNNYYMIIAIICLLLATSITFILAIFLIVFLINRRKNKHKIVET